MAIGVLDKDSSTYLEAMEMFQPFTDIVALGSNLECTFHPDYMEARLLVGADDVLPKQAYTLTPTGKLSKKDMGITKFNELYQDHVCSALLRVGRETLALLPVRFVVVHALSDLVNPVTGKMEPLDGQALL